MSEAQTQAVIRVVRLILVAIIGVIIANVTVFIGLIPDDSTKYLVTIVAIPLLEGIAKLIGGPTATPVAVPRGAARDRVADKAARPNPLSV